MTFFLGMVFGALAILLVPKLWEKFGFKPKKTEFKSEFKPPHKDRRG